MAKSKTQDDVWEDIGDTAARRRASKSLGEKGRPLSISPDYSYFPQSMTASALPGPPHYAYQQEQTHASSSSSSMGAMGPLHTGVPNATVDQDGGAVVGGIKRKHASVQQQPDQGEVPLSLWGQLDQSNNSQHIPSLAPGGQHQQLHQERNLFSMQQPQQMLQQEELLQQPPCRTNSQRKKTISDAPVSSAMLAVAGMPLFGTKVARCVGSPGDQLQRQETLSGPNAQQSKHRSDNAQSELALHGNSGGRRGASLMYGSSLNHLSRPTDTIGRPGYDPQPQHLRQRQQRNDDNIYALLPTAAELVNNIIFTSSSSSVDGGEAGIEDSSKDTPSHLGMDAGDLFESAGDA